MRKPFLFICGLIIAGVLSALAAGNRSAESGPQSRSLSRYYYLEGIGKQAENKHPEAYEYFKKAYLTDTTYAEAANAYGLFRLWVESDTLMSSAEQKRSLALIRKFVDTYPTDVNEARTYALLASRIDTVAESVRIFERLDSLLPANNITLLQLSEAYLNSGNTDKAISTLSRYESLEGKSVQVSLRKISLMLQKGDTVGAVDEASELVASNRKSPEFLLLKGNLYEVIGDNDSTLAYYRKAEALNPESGEIKLAFANYYKWKGDSVEFDNKMYEALLSEDFELEDKLGILGDYLQTLLSEKNDTKRGDHLFSVLLDQYPHEAQVLDLAARYSSDKGDYKDAEEAIGYAIDQDLTNETYWGQLMSYQVVGDRPEAAMSTYERASGHITPSENLKLIYISAALGAKDYDESERMCGELIHDINPELPLTDSIPGRSALEKLTYDQMQRLATYYTMLGDSYYQAGDASKGFAAYDNALFMEPSNPLTLNNYAYFLAESNGDLEKARRMSEKALELDAENPTYIDTYAWILFKLKDYKEALEFQQKAIEISEKNGEEPGAEYFHHMGDILFMNHEPAKALENWEKALKLDPENELLKKKVKNKTFYFE